MAEFWSKRDREKKKQQAKKDKEERKRERKENARDGNVLDNMIAYVDENGNLTSEPQDLSKRQEVSLDDIQIGVPKMEDRNPEDMYEEGVVTFFNDEKGYGFIRHSKTKQSIFVHSKQLSAPVQINDKVRFTIVKGMKGPEAAEVSLIK
ncbi:MAG TPA: DNA-binding protein [Chitinophagaceae bacterium]|nr:DNA-binding protein [Chitinophagaceae bacterium]